MLIWIGLGLGLALVLGAAYVRLAPIKVEQVPRPQNLVEGDYPVAGGFYSVRQVSDPAQTLQALREEIKRTPRTQMRHEDVFITRSKLWGFPDVTRIWIEGNTLHIAGHLVYGKSDLGVNRRRIREWLSAIEL